MPVYPQENAYTRHEVQAQIPRIRPELLYQSTAPTVYDNQQVHANGDAFRSNSRLSVLPRQNNANVPPPIQAQIATNGYSIPASNSSFAQPLVPSPDSQVVLLALAEQYFMAAFGQGSGAEVHGREKDIKVYYKLIATGLGCLDAVLRVLRYPLPWGARLNSASREDCPHFWKPELGYGMLRYYFRRQRIIWKRKKRSARE
ncbi:hypothetical protein MMC34_005380 [Xylographa carneopallida]|nr:hypothetical protein [Xylographa carneopallida]